VLAGSEDASRCIGYLTKYLTKQLGDCHHPDTGAQRGHTERLAGALRHEPCSPTCANWPRHGVPSPRTPGPGWRPAPARARPTDMAISAPPGEGCWSRTSGQAQQVNDEPGGTMAVRACQRQQAKCTLMARTGLPDPPGVELQPSQHEHKQSVEQ